MLGLIVSEYNDRCREGITTSFFFLRMQYIKNSMQRNSGLPLLNKNDQTPEEVFPEKHKDLVKMGGEWLTSTCNVLNISNAMCYIMLCMLK